MLKKKTEQKRLLIIIKSGRAACQNTARFISSRKNEITMMITKENFAYQCWNSVLFPRIRSASGLIRVKRCIKNARKKYAISITGVDR